jgi:hypothetical protein
LSGPHGCTTRNGTPIPPKCCDPAICTRLIGLIHGADVTPRVAPPDIVRQLRRASRLPSPPLGAHAALTRAGRCPIWHQRIDATSSPHDRLGATLAIQPPRGIGAGF